VISSYSPFVIADLALLPNSYFAAYNLYRTLALSLRAEHISVLMSGMENSGCVRWYVYET